MHIVIAHITDQVICRGDQQIHALLLADDTNIAQQGLGAFLQRRITRTNFKFLDFGGRAHHKNIVRRHLAAPDGNVAKAFIGGNRHICRGKGQPFPDQHDPVQQTLFIKLGFKQFRAHIVMIKQIAHP